MFCHRNIFKLVLFSLLLSLVFTLALVPTETSIDSAQGEPHEGLPEHQGLQIERKPQRVFAPHWTTEGNLLGDYLHSKRAHLTCAKR